MLVEYVHDFNENSERPGREIFRVLMPNWEEFNNYELIDPIFDEWFTEEITYNTKNGSLVYKINGVEYRMRAFPLKKNYIRIFMHSYGKNTGHTMKMERFEVNIESIN